MYLLSSTVFPDNSDKVSVYTSNHMNNGKFILEIRFNHGTTISPSLDSSKIPSRLNKLSNFLNLINSDYTHFIFSTISFYSILYVGRCINWNLIQFNLRAITIVPHIPYHGILDVPILNYTYTVVK